MLFTIDTDRLNTNTITTLGVDAIQKFLDPKRPVSYLVIKLLEINLIGNYFKFGNEYNLQISWTAVGKEFAPSYANIFIACLEETALATSPLKPLHYYRFLDDKWGIWIFSRMEFDSLLKY